MVSGDTVELYLYDVIGWPWIEAQDIVNAIPEGTRRINVRINSPGGSVFEGLTIYNWLKQHTAEVHVTIDGLAASVASVIAMVGDTVTIPETAFLMIHDPWVLMVGNAEDLRREADLLEEIEGVVAKVYADHAGQEIETVRQWMHEETWFSGEKAVENGFASALSEGDAVQQGHYDLDMYSRGPVMAAIKKEVITMETKEVLTDEQKAEVRAAEKARQKEIKHICSLAGLGDAFASTLIDEDATIEVAREAVFAQMAKDNPPVGPGRIIVGESDEEKFSKVARDGILMRAGVKVDKPAAGAEEVRGWEMSQVVRRSLMLSGHDVSRLNSRRAIADYIFTGRQMSHTTSDFPAIFRDVANKTLQAAYEEQPATYQIWCGRSTAPDLKQIYGIALSEAPELDLVQEAEEYKYGAMKEKQEYYRVYKYGKLIKLTLEMLINDDLRAFTRLPRIMGVAAKRKENTLVYAHLTSGASNRGPTLAEDSVQLFNAGHGGNLLSTGRAITADNLDAARRVMRAQQGLNGTRLNIQPQYLIISPRNEMVTDVLLTSAGSVTANLNAGVTNPMQGRFVSIVEPYLLDVFNSGLGWYLAANPNQIDTVEVSFLEGYETPQVIERENFTVDSIEWKVRHFFGVGVMDFRGLVLNDGTA